MSEATEAAPVSETSLPVSVPTIERPLGVAALALVLAYVGAMFSVGVVALLLAARGLLGGETVAYDFSGGYPFFSYHGPASGVPAFAAGLAVMGALHAGVGAGLWYRHGWARLAGVGLGALAFAASVGTFASLATFGARAPLPPGFALLQAMVSVATGAGMVWYLTRDGVRAWFADAHP